MSEKPEETTEKEGRTSKRASSREDWSSGEVKVSELQQGSKDSDSVRRLQHHLKVKVTGDWDDATRFAVRRWQNENGYEGGRGLNPDQEQAESMLGDKYTVKSE